jgi:hypothetical protein
MENRRTPRRSTGSRGGSDAEIERLAERIAEVVNAAGPEQRSDLREYALELLKEGTEIGDVPEARPEGRDATGSNPLGLALLLGAAGLPALLLFAPIGLTLLAIAAVMGVFGVVETLWRRR